MTQEEINEHICGVALLQQFSLKAGLKHFGKKGEEAVSSELTQMHAMAMYEHVAPETLSQQQKKDALRSLSLIHI